MEQSFIDQALLDICETQDRLEKELKYAGLICAAAKEEGFNLVVVGGSAIEFYTDGAYMSGDIDICREGSRPMPLRFTRALMHRLGAEGVTRTYNFRGELFVDILGEVERMAPRAQYQTMQTAYGEIKLMPVEELLVDRVLIGVYPSRNEQALDCARILLACCLDGTIPVDWTAAEEMARSPAYKIATEYLELKMEVAHVLSNRKEMDMGGMASDAKTALSRQPVDHARTPPATQRRKRRPGNAQSL